MSAANESLSRVEGIQLALRLVEQDDADYVYGLRTDPAYNAHLSPVKGTVDDQRAWIERYKAREACGQEYYYVIERMADGVSCGLVRLYDVQSDSFTWGSWILDANKPQKAAVESALLSFGIGFDHLGIPKALIDVRRDNSRALNFYRRLSMEESRADEVDIYFTYTSERYFQDRAQLIDILRKASTA